MNPGRTVLPLASMTRPPFAVGASPFLLIDFILSPSTRITASFNAGFPVPSMTVPPSITRIFPEAGLAIFSLLLTLLIYRSIRVASIIVRARHTSPIERNNFSTIRILMRARWSWAFAHHFDVLQHLLSGVAVV